MLTAVKPVVPVFAKPDASSVLTDELLYGQQAELIAEESGFYKIKTFYGYIGFSRPEDFLSGDWKPEYIVTSSFLDVLATPEYRKNPVFSLPRGSLIQIDETVGENNYVGITLADGTSAFCVKYHVKKRFPADYWKTHESETRESLVRTALKYLETPYRWGGKSPYGVDCSGLCSCTYLQHEIIIWRDAQLREPLRSISKEELKPGDLLFFPGHVAMYIGQNRFVHSNQKYSGVCINSLEPHDPDFSEKLLQSIEGMGSAW